jgi:hypothetical protein
LLIPGLNKAWVYHFDEGNWTQVYFNKGQLLGPAGIFSGNNSGSPEIIQLVGTIAQQSWTPASLVNAAPLDTMAISDVNAQTVSLLSFGIPASTPTAGSINKTDAWYIKSGALTFDDSRHGHTVKKIRFCFIDGGAVTVSVRLTNEYGQTKTQTITYGNGSGATITKVIEFSLAGKYITWELSGPPGVNFGFSEIGIVYDVGGEVQGGAR